MNAIDAIRAVLEYACSYLDIVPGTSQMDINVIAVSQMVAAYDALAPDWSRAPEGAQWFAIDAYGDCYWHESEPSPSALAWDSGTADFAGFIFSIPLSIDWRLCSWRRQEEMA